MIVVKLVGGLASQLHKYAIARALAEKHNTLVKYDLFALENTPETDTKYDFKIGKFNISAERATENEISRLKPNRFLLKIRNGIKRISGYSYHFSSYCNTSFMSIDSFFNLPEDVYLEGEWVGSRYFENIREILQKELTLKPEYARRSETFLDNFTGDTPLISMHIRRGDFLKNPNAAKFHCTCSTEYYIKAIAHMKKTLENFKLLIFSDEIQWVKKNFDFLKDHDKFFVEGLEDFEEFQIMARCNSNIIANSGFSWFASWLNQHPKKIVVAPEHWVYDDKINRKIVESIADKNICFINNK